MQEAASLGYKNATFVRETFTQLGAVVHVCTRVAWKGFVEWLLWEEQHEHIAVLLVGDQDGHSSCLRYATLPFGSVG